MLTFDPRLDVIFFFYVGFKNRKQGRYIDILAFLHSFFSFFFFLR